MNAPHFTPRLRTTRCPALAIALVAAAAASGACGGHFSAGTADTPAARSVEGAPPAAEAASRAAEVAAAVDRLGWMVGCWERRGDDRHVEEQWKAPSGGTMLGQGRTVRAGRTVQRETLRIEARSGRLVYVASPSGQATTEFTATAITDTLAVFDNPAHDFPQRVVYRPGRGDSLWARIEGEIDGRPRAVDFRMARAACAAPDAAQQSDGAVLALTHVTVIDGTGAAPRPDMTVVVRGDRIEGVVRSGESPLPVGAEVHDLTGRFLIPGLVSAHDHFMNAGLADSPERIRAELRRMLYGGVTLARDANGDARLLAVLQRSLRIGEVVGPDIYYAAHMSGPDFIALDRRVGRASAGFRRGEPAWMQVVTPDTDVAWAVGRAAGTHATGLKLYVGVEADVIRALTREAHARGLQVWAHSTVFPDRPIDVVRAGVDAVSHLCWLAWQDEDLDPAENVPFTHTSYPEPRPSFDPALVEPDSPEMTLLFREMADHGTLLDATHSAYASGAGSTRGCTPELMTGLARAAHRAGVPFVTGTDYYVDAEEPFPSVHREIEYLVDQRVLSPLEAITAATHHGARLLDLAHTHGTIAPGMAASLVVLAEDPSVDIRALRSVVTVLHRGEWYPRDTRTLSP